MDQVTPVLTPLSDVTPGEPDHLVVVDGCCRQPVAFSSSVPFEELRAPYSEIGEVTEDLVVARPDASGERKRTAPC